jgi:hypothetical protein
MLKKWLYVPDAHHPYVDKRAWQIMLRAMQHFKPHGICIMGDFVDCAPISFHTPSPGQASLAEELKAGQAAIADLEALGAKEHHYIEGNHEFRLPRYLHEKAPEIAEFLSFKAILGLSAKWKYTPYKKFLEHGKVYVTHDLERAGRGAHEQALTDAQDNVIIGHAHSMGVSYRGNARGKTHVGAIFGWLGDKTCVNYRHRLLANRYWTLGFGIGYMETNGTVHVQAIPIIEYKCVIEGKLIVG